MRLPNKEWGREDLETLFSILLSTEYFFISHSFPSTLTSFPASGPWVRKMGGSFDQDCLDSETTLHVCADPLNPNRSHSMGGEATVGESVLSPVQPLVHTITVSDRSLILPCCVNQLLCCVVARLSSWQIEQVLNTYQTKD